MVTGAVGPTPRNAFERGDGALGPSFSISFVDHEVDRLADDLVIEVR